MKVNSEDSLTMELSADVLLHVETVCRLSGLKPIDGAAALMLALGLLTGAMGPAPTAEVAFEGVVFAGRPLFAAGFELGRKRKKG